MIEHDRVPEDVLFFVEMPEDKVTAVRIEAV